MQCHLMVSSGSRKVVVLVQCVRVVQLNCVKVQCMAYCKVGVCSRVYYFWLFIVLIAWGEKLFLSRLVWDRMLWRRLPEGSRESSLWDGVWNHWWSSGFSLYTAWCRCPGGREDPLQSRLWAALGAIAMWAALCHIPTLHKVFESQLQVCLLINDVISD